MSDNDDQVKVRQQAAGQLISTTNSFFCLADTPDGALKTF